MGDPSADDTGRASCRRPSQMTLQHFELSTVFQADDVVGRSRFFNRHRRVRPGRCTSRPAYLPQRPGHPQLSNATRIIQPLHIGVISLGG
jgi:hypothetical protein